MNSANLCIFEGRISSDPEYSQFTVQDQNGTRQVDKARFNIAVDRQLSSAQRQKAKNDNSIKTADFIPINLVGAQVGILKQYFYKGKGIRVVCHYQEYQTTDQATGQKKYGHTFEADSIGFCIQDPQNGNHNNGGSNANSGGNYGGGGYTQPQQQPANQPQQQQPDFNMFDESESPF